MPKYVFKRAEEIAWIALVAAGVFALTLLVDFDPDKIEDWRAWAIALGAGCIRAAAGAVLALFTKP
jgi:hypothetical protein